MLSKYTERFGPYALALLRIVVGLTFLMHGYPKFQDLAGTAGFFGFLGIPAAGLMAPLVATIETVGGALLIIGLGTRYVNVLQAIVMLMAILTFKLSVGFIAPGDQPGTGYELDLLLLTSSLVMLCFGPGSPSIDKNVLKREL